MGAIFIAINKWSEFNPRKDRKEHHWFRVDNTIPFSQSLDGLSADQKWFWICLLSFFAKNDAMPVEYDAPYFEKHVGISKKKMDDALEHLESKGVLTISAVTGRLPGGDQVVTERCPTYVRTNVRTNIPAEPASPDFDFESLYKIHPRKRGKDEGMRRLKDRIKDEITFDLFAKAVRKHASECAMERRDQKFIQHWSSFVGTKDKEPWRDYLQSEPMRPTSLPPLALVQNEPPPASPYQSMTEEQHAAQCAKIRDLMVKAGFKKAVNEDQEFSNLTAQEAGE